MLRRPSPLGRLAGILAVALAYWGAGVLSLHLALFRGQVTPIWPPTGIALVALLRLGMRAWPGITLGALLVNWPLGPAPLAVLGITAGNTLAPVLAAAGLRRIGFHVQIDRLVDALALIVIGGLLGMLVSASCGSTVLLAAGAITPAQFWATWATWWTGDAMGVIVVAPFLLSLRRYPPSEKFKWWRAFEFAALLISSGVVTYLVFKTPLKLSYLAFPLVMATAWRFRQRGSAAALIASGVTVWTAVQNSGSFHNQSILEKMITLQAFNVWIAFSSFVLVSAVITRERREELNQLYEAQKIASQSKDEFLNTAAHELRTPLAVVRGYLLMLFDGGIKPASTEWNDALRIIDAKTAELAALVDDLLTASRIESNQQPQPLEIIDLRMAVHAAVSRARPRANLLKGDISLEVPAEPVAVRARPDDVSKILDNLLNNSLSYSRAPATVAVQLVTDDVATVRVRDSGIGIPLDEQAMVFQRFHRLNDPAGDSPPGTGLGLYIGRELAKRNRATLDVEVSLPGQGSTFKLSFPLVRVAREAQVTLESPLAPAAPAVPPVEESSTPSRLRHVEAEPAEAVAVKSAGKRPSDT